jgi:hypothetical protein
VSNHNHNFRALCAELVNDLHDYKVANEQYEDALVNRARAALAQPEPQGPSEKEWDELRAHFERILCDALSSGGPVVGNIALADHLINAVYARWGHPAIEPVPVSERLPGPGDCSPSGYFWAYAGDDWEETDINGRSWQYWRHHGYTHWLPHYALPVPQQQEVE